MEINHYNYEEYFLLYIDNELSAADRKAVEFFLEHNTYLKSEFEALQQLLLRADDNVIFPGMESLLKDEPSLIINTRNCEEYFVQYGDNELTGEEKRSVEEFLYRNPEQRPAFELIQKAKLQPDTVTDVFRNKEILYKREKPVYLHLAKWAVAAAIVIAAGLFWINDHDFSGKLHNPSIAYVDSSKKPQEKAGTKNEVVSAVNDDSLQEVNTTEKSANEENELMATNNQKQKQNRQKNNFNTTNNTVQNNPGLDGNESLPVAVNNNSTATNPKLIATTIEPLQNNNAIIYKVNVPGSIQSDIGNESLAKHVVEIENPEDNRTDLVNADPEKKSTLRGFLRKASRIIERNADVGIDERLGALFGSSSVASNNAKP